MTGRMRPHYGFRVAHSLIPCVEVTIPDSDIEPGGLGGWRTVEVTRVVKRRYGFTLSHAISRATTWMRKHGDPR